MPAVNSRTVELSCSRCEKIFRVSRCRAHIAKFCSRACKNFVVKLSRECPTCGVAFFVTAGRADVGRGKYCSKKCYRKLPLADIFFSHVGKKQADGCILWDGCQNAGGYGRMRDDSGREIVAHRVSYMLLVGPIKDGLCVCHKCDNRLCINQTHLFLGTQEENAQDMVAKNRHGIGTRNGRAKLTDDQVREIRRRWPGQSQSALAQEFGVSHVSIGLIVNGKTWRHLLAL